MFCDDCGLGDYSCVCSVDPLFEGAFLDDGEFYVDYGYKKYWTDKQKENEENQDSDDAA